MEEPTAVFGELDPAEITGIVQEPYTIPCWIYRRDGEEQRQEPPLSIEERARLLKRYVLRRRCARKMLERIEAVTKILFPLVMDGSTDMWLKSPPQAKG